MTDFDPTDLSRLPHRMTTSEVCALARWSPRTLIRRHKTGEFTVQPCGRGRQKLYNRDEVLRALGLMHDEQRQEPPAVPAPSWDCDGHGPYRSRRRGASSSPPPPPADVSLTGLGAISATRAAPKRQPPKARPTADVSYDTLTRKRGLMLSVLPSVRVTLDTDTELYTIVFLPRSNHRPTDWPVMIQFPRANPRPVALATEKEFLAIRAEVEATVAECKAALKKERAG